jgi:ATP-binding cassette subfamily B protein
MASLYTLIPYLRGHRRTLFWGLVSLLLTDAMQMAGPWVLKLAVDGLETDITRGRLAAYAGLVVALALVAGVFRFLMRRLMIGTSREIEYELRGTFFAKLTGLSYAYFNRTPTGDLMARATNDLNAVRAVLGPGIMYSVNTVVTLTATVTLMILLNWKLTLIALVPMPIISLFMYRYGKVIHKRFETVQEQFSSITSRAQEYLSGIRVVKAYDRESIAREDFRVLNQEYLDRYMRLVRINGLVHPAIGFLAGSATVLVLLFGGTMVIRDTLTLGSFVAFFAYLNMLIWPMIALGWVVSIFQRGAASMKRINQVLNTPADVAGPPGDVDPGSIRGDLVFENVSFAYGGRSAAPVLDGLSFGVAAGETVGIAGRTGSGKTSLVNLIPRLFDPTSGRILLDGKDLREYPLDAIRGAIGYVPQEAFLFSRTLSENIAFGRPDADSELVEEMAALAYLSPDVRDFPEQYATMVGERGVTLSGGQKQRAAIARALLREPRILILDDALAAVDTGTEEAILTGLRRFMQDRTTFLVAHRVSTLKLADRILVLEEGRIIDAGTHDELIARGGAYAEFARLQELEAQLEATL